jgi:hypothetical protein
MNASPRPSLLPQQSPIASLWDREWWLADDCCVEIVAVEYLAVQFCRGAARDPNIDLRICFLHQN